MNYRTLGQTGLSISEIGLGAYPISGMWQRPDGSDFGWTGTDDRESIASDPPQRGRWASTSSTPPRSTVTDTARC